MTEADRITSLLASFIAVAEDLDLETILQRTVEAACAATGAKYGALGVISAHDKTRLRHFVTVGFDSDTIAEIGNYPQGHGVLGLLIREPRALRLHDLRTHPESYGFPPGHPQMVSFLGVPVRSRDRVFGNLYLTEKIGADDFTLDDEQLAIAVAAAAGVAIENSRLYEQTNARRQWLQAAVDVEQRLLQRSSDGHVLDYITERIQQIAPGLHVTIVHRAVTQPTMKLTDAETLAQLPRLEGLREQVILVPLSATKDSNHTIVVGSPPGSDAISTEFIEHITTFASRVSRSFEIAEAQSLRERLAVFEDRDRIALDLHDLVIQRLFAAGLSIQGLRRFIRDDAAHARIDAVTQEIDESIRELRRTIYSLTKPSDSLLGAREAILDVTSSTANLVGFEPVVRLSGPLDTALDGEMRDHLLAVLREALSNAARHSGATSIDVDVTANRGELELVVTDNGRGMSPGGHESGLRNIRQRAADLGGSVRIDTAVDNGFKLSWRIPVGPRTPARGE